MSTPVSSLKLPFRLSVCGKSEVDDFADQAVTHLLSLEDPGTPKETPRWFKGLHEQLLFHDVESAADAFLMDGTAVTPAQVADILRFGEECLEASRHRPVHLLIHCFAGASRSPAACFAIAAQRLGPGRAKEALDFVISLRPEALPNLLLVKHADKLLARRGELTRALAVRRNDFRRAITAWAAALERDRGSQTPSAKPEA